MITLDQVRALEARVEKALGAIDRLTAENTAFRETASREIKRSADLERTLEEYRRDQNRIEQGILHALERLNAFEDTIQDSSLNVEEKPANTRPPSSASVAKTAAPAPKSPVPAAKPEASESASSAEDGITPESGTAGAELEIF